ncbi:hypothetical protein BX661DRAFT_188946 [Kickxella alabastrina]|uniref:uncharacterized protein n=1 Tax=Kickxella alabastrina TaxID=61397 RepID=UPI00221FB93C|nr:uncharacterized protein BX661DRAFT_188946 [Kickxella alabastrina]KAI7820759.1 hypothetical protein BX661DRAFT_188946 [Kickxella alabastrina]
MWLRDLINFSEKIALIVHHALPFPGFLIVIFLSWYETVYCLAHRLFPSETRAEETINQYIREHRLYDEQPKKPPKQGIGFETARAIGLAGYTTILACRNLKRGQQAQRELQDATGLDSFVVMELDLSSFMSIERFAKQFMDEYSQLHLLVCNAGMAFSHYDTTYDGLESQFGTNYVDMMKRSGGARITIASSISACMIRHIDYSRVTDVWRFDRLINYSTSKLALMVYSNALARQLKDTDVTVNAFHPGFLYRNVAFSMLPGIHEFRNWLWLDQKKGSVTSIYLALSPELSGKSSGYYARQQPAVMHPDACNIKVQDRLCQFTEVLIATNTHSQSVLDSINSSRIVQ